MKIQQNTPSRRLLAACLAVVASLAALLALAQDPAPAAPATDADRSDAPPSADEGGTDAPLEDYEASEQISEDLSVSFPVDI